MTPEASAVESMSGAVATSANYRRGDDGLGEDALR